MSTAQRYFTEDNQMVATAIAETDSRQLAPSDPMAIIAALVQSGQAEASQLRELLELQREWAKDRAAEAYGAAITRFQQLCPRIHKDRKVTGGGMNFAYASFEDVMAQASPHLTACGIALSFSTEKNDCGIRVTCRVRVGIHAEDYTLDVPVPALKTNDTQRYGAALTYAKRYALCAALNIVVCDEDDDAQSCIDPVNEDQHDALDKMMIRVVEKHGEAERGRLLKWMRVDRLGDVPAAKFDKAMQGMKDALNAPQKP